MERGPEEGKRFGGRKSRINDQRELMGKEA